MKLHLEFSAVCDKLIFGNLIGKKEFAEPEV
jgi:hypothetical protein